jgi:integrase
VVQFLEAVSSLKSRAALTTAYAAGLRASEVAGLRIEDIDSARGVIQVRHGKGTKDRNVMLSPNCLVSCARTGGWPGRGFIYFRDATKITRSIRPCCTPPAGRR